MEIYGLIGKEINHSYSPDFFKQKFDRLHVDADYRLFPLAHIDELSKLIATTTGLRGLNVTIPYKQMVSPFLHEIDNAASCVGAINTIKVGYRNNALYLTGYNTDIIGFEQSLVPFIRGRKNLKALILGTGGSSKAIAYILRKLGIIFMYVSRNPQKVSHIGYQWLTPSIMSKYNLIINTTPLGMSPLVDDFPKIPYQLITSDHYLYDLIYNPQETSFLKFGKANGAHTMGGLEMFELQAEASWKIWKK